MTLTLAVAFCIPIAPVAQAATPPLSFAPSAPVSGTPPLVNDGAVTVQPQFLWDGVNDQVTLDNTLGEVGVIITYPNHPGAQDQIVVPGWSSISAFTVADFDGDGHPDLVLHGSNGADEQLAVVLGEGPLPPGSPPPALAQFSTPLVFNGNNSQIEFYVNDLNGDGKDDIIYTDPRGISGIGVAISTSTPGSPSFNFNAGPAPNCISGPVNGVATAELNGDGIRDLVMSCKFFNIGAEETVAFAGLPGGGYAPGVVVSNTVCPGTPQIGDINGDGTLDVGDCFGDWAVNTTPPVALPEAPWLPALILIFAALLGGYVMTQRRSSRS